MSNDNTPTVAAVPAAWQPIETAPKNLDRPVVVLWLGEDGEERHDFDCTEDGCWMQWHDHAEHVHMIGGHGVSYEPPYTHWMPLPAAPGAVAAVPAPDLRSAAMRALEALIYHREQTRPIANTDAAIKVLEQALSVAAVPAEPVAPNMMIVCQTCGDKRCVHAKDHAAPCAKTDIYAHNAWVERNAAPQATPPAPAEQERESTADALLIVESYGPWGPDLNDAHRRQIVLADEVMRLQHELARLRHE